MTKQTPHRTVRPIPADQDRDLSLWEAFYAVVTQVPAGRVATYGQIARLAGYPRHARHVGYALAALPAERIDVPWQRIINSRGEVSPRKRDGMHRVQQGLLEEEGVIFVAGRVNLRRFQWNPGPEHA